MDAKDPWLRRGDIFDPFPVLEVRLSASLITMSSGTGAAVLLTHGCAMSKANAAGTPKIERLQFARLRLLDAADRDQAAALRKRRIGPYEAMQVGDVAPYG